MLYYQLLLSDFFFLLALYSGCIGIIQFYKLVALFIKKKSMCEYLAFAW